MAGLEGYPRTGHSVVVAESGDVAAAFEKYTPHWSEVRYGDPHQSLKLVRSPAEDAPDTDHQAALAVALIELWSTAMRRSSSTII